MKEVDGFGPGPPPDLSVVAFRNRTKSGEPDRFTERLLRYVQDEGRVMLSGTRIDGHYTLRCAILSFRTHIEDVDEAIDALLRGVARLQGVWDRFAWPRGPPDRTDERLAGKAWGRRGGSRWSL